MTRDETPRDPLRTFCWACGHPSHGPGDRGSGCDSCFCTQTEDIGGRPLASSTQDALDVDRWAKYIVGHYRPRDWACIQCGANDMVVAGFQCVWHQAEAQRAARGQQ